MFNIKKKINDIEKKFEKIYNSKFTSIEFLQKILFYLGTIFLFLHRCWDYTPFVSILTVREHFIYIGIILLILKICITKEKLTKYIKYTLFLVISFLCDKATGANYKVLSMVLYIIATRNIDIKSIFKFHFIFNCCIIISNVFCYTCTEFFNIYIPNLKEFDYIYREGLIRHGFYFYHPNAFSFYLFFTYIIYIYLRYENINLSHKKNLILHFGISIFLSFFCFFFMKTRVAVILFLSIIPILLVFQSKRIVNTKLFQYCIPLTNIIIFSISFIMLFFYNQNNFLGNIMNEINNLLSNRLYLASDVLEKYGLFIFGPPLESMPDLIIDNGYFYLLLKSGILVSLFIFWYFTKALYNFTEKKSYPELYVIFMFLIYCFIEALFIHPTVAYPLAFLGLFI